MKLRTIITILIIVLFLSMIVAVAINMRNQQPAPQPQPQGGGGRNIRVASWNLQVFGDKKAQNDTIRKFVASKIRENDIFVAQELHTGQNGAIMILWNEVRNDGYDVKISQPAGADKEQYAMFYRRDTVTPIRTNDLSLSDVYYRYWERPPFEVTFETRENYTFTVLTLHTKPTNAENETHQLDWITSTMTGDVMVIGDLNADCDYLKMASTYALVNWTWAIPDNADTTSGPSDCAYDRIVVNPSMTPHLLQAGIDKTTNYSDHYEIWGVVTPKAGG